MERIYHLVSLLQPDTQEERSIVGEIMELIESE